MSGTDRRGEVVAMLGGLLSLLSAIVLVLLAFTTRNAASAVWACAALLVGALGLWLITIIQLHQRRLVVEESLEVEQLERHRREKLGGVETIFDEDDIDQMDKLATGRRLRAIERFLVPTVALLVALYFIAAGVLVLPWRYQLPLLTEAAGEPINQAMVLAIACSGIAFVCFMLSRYALGMARLEQWQILCAGGNISFAASAATIITTIAMLGIGYGGLREEIGNLDQWATWPIGILMILLGIESLINFTLDLYRPRVAGQRQRPFYDSRLVGLFSEPGGMLQSLAKSIDYQFGFKVSETWFYKLLGQHLPRLVLFQIIVIFALTCILVVPPGHQAVIEHFGEVRAETAQPGLHFKWFWPIDQATVIPVERIQRIELGHEIEAKKEDQYDGPILWTQQHYKNEYLLLIADRHASRDTKVPVNLVSMDVPIQWRIKPDDASVIRYYAQSEDVAAIVESLAYRELTQYSANADLLDLIGEGGIKTTAILHDRLQHACDHAGFNNGGLGVEIVYVGMGTVHPPAREEVAKAYEDVVSAMEKKEARIMAAEGEATQIRIGSAGLQWSEIYSAIMAEDKARMAGDASLPEHARTVERLLRESSGGDAREMVARAAMRTIERVFSEKSAAERYEMQLIAFKAAPHIYLLQDYLRLLRNGLQDIRKYIVVLDDPDKVIYNMDLRPPSGMDTLGAEISAMESASE